VRVAVISDVHGDLSALEVVLASIDATEPDEIWCLGDIVGLGGHEPAEAVELVRERCGLALAGNHDGWVTGTLTLAAAAAAHSARNFSGSARS
jgi:predicted phosphodiesterase